MLSGYGDDQSVVSNGFLAGNTLSEVLEVYMDELVGGRIYDKYGSYFPLLFKMIDAQDDLSIQVHPNDQQAADMAMEKDEEDIWGGKTEMWVVTEAADEASIIVGFNQKTSTEEVADSLLQGSLMDLLQVVPVKKGDVLFIESGTLHAIGKGILIAEIQQNSNVTYRIYDYGRVGADGKKRDLHIEKALDVTNRIPIVKSGSNYPHLADCDYFTVDKLNLDGKLTYRMQGTVDERSFLSILILDGKGTISCKNEKLDYRKGDSFILLANSGDWQIDGECDALLTTIREKANPIRVGVNIGSSEIQMGIINDQNKLLDVRKYPTNPKRHAEQIIDETAENILKILAENKIPLEQCVGVGVGVPGTIDRQEGKVIYSNNLRWEDVSLTKQLGEVIPCPVRIANDADCAALGEAIEGAGKNFSDVVMFTLGNGVGGGIILRGEVFEGGIMGGSEVGHQVIRVHGRLCSCGRKGCLEAYVSVPALLKSAAQVLGREVSLEEIFKLYRAENVEMMEVVEQYILMLGQGLVNIVNMFRPQLILLGGAMSVYAENLIEPLNDILQEDCFGGVHAPIPKISIAELGSDAGMIGAANL